MGLKTIVVAGARPNFMKVAPIIDALTTGGHTSVLVHTGQHYDATMSDAFFRDLDMKEPEYNLGAGPGSHAAQTARVMTAFEPVLLEERPDWVIVVGDVNSTLACALVVAKLRDRLPSKLAHVEAGLRSHDWTMPEEVNRLLTDRIADLLLTPSPEAEENLLAEGIEAWRIRFVGNVMIDSLCRSLPRAVETRMPERLGMPREGYVVATLHRPSNVDDPERLSTILVALNEIAQRMPVVLPLHPRTRQRADAAGLGDLLKPMTLLEPLSYLEMISLVEGSAVVLTDSGGIQEETTVLGIPCVTLRESTERPVTVTEGTNRLVGWPITTPGVVAAFEQARAAGRVPVHSKAPEGWDGRASFRIVEALAQWSPPAPGAGRK